MVNAFVHSRDGYTAVVSTGLILPGTVAAILGPLAQVLKVVAAIDRGDEQITTDFLNNLGFEVVPTFTNFWG